jgi:hypothetical protein
MNCCRISLRSLRFSKKFLKKVSICVYLRNLRLKNRGWLLRFLRLFAAKSLVPIFVLFATFVTFCKKSVLRLQFREPLRNRIPNLQPARVRHEHTITAWSERLSALQRGHCPVAADHLVVTAAR